MPKLSVVIPIYNAEAFLRSSLDSVLAQSIGDLEVLCTDDGSSDSSLEILKEYAQKDSRVRYFCQENKGAGPARNLALSNARGEYVVFMDGDDSYPRVDTLEQLYNAAKKNNCAIVAGYRTMLTEEGIHTDINDPLYKLALKYPNGTMLSYREVQFDFNYQCYCFSHELIRDNNISFPDYRRCQDPPFLVRAMLAAENFYLLPISSYQYRWGHQNIQWNKRKINDLMKAHIDLLQLSRDAELEKLHGSVAGRLEYRYKDVILSCVNRENLELPALLIYANGITDFEWLKNHGGKKRKTNWYASVVELTDKLAKVFTLAAGISDAVLLDMVEEIYTCYEQLADADERFLNDVILCTLVKMYHISAPAYIRRQLMQFLHSPRFERIDKCHGDKQEVISALKTLEQMEPAFAFGDRLEYLKDDASCTCRCVLDSRKLDQPKISVIVPVYNVEKYLEDCLESLLDQSCTDLEIICVNDGSTDSSMEIAMRYAGQNPGFVVLDQNNSGLSAARNSGLRYARGKYIHFLDSDDFMKPTSYEQLLAKAEQQNLDMLFFDGESIYEDESLRREFPWYETGYKSKASGDGITDGETYFVNAVLEADFRISACMYIVRREFLENHRIRFIEGLVHEDNYFTYACTLLSERTSHLSAQLYGRRVCRGSITIRDKKFRHAYGYFRSYLELRAFVDRSNISQSMKDIVSLKLISMLTNARTEYEKIGDPVERQLYLGLSPVEAEQFYLMVVCSSKCVPIPKTPVESKVAMGLVRRVIQCCQDHGVRYTVRYSFWKIGMILRRGLKCCRDHGIVYTFKRAFRKVFSKK